MSETMLKAWDKSLDVSFYTPDEEEKAFMKEATGIQDDEELKNHVITVQTKAFKVNIPPLYYCPKTQIHVTYSYTVIPASGYSNF